MPSFSLRLDVFGEDEAVYRGRVIAFMGATLKATGLGCFEHPNGQNKHYHFMFHTCMKLDATRKAIQKLLRELRVPGGNAAYSLKNKAGDERYICKGHVAAKENPNSKKPHYDLTTQSPPQIIWNTEGYTDEDINEFHERFWEDQQNLYGRKEKKKPFKDVLAEHFDAIVWTVEGKRMFPNLHAFERASCDRKDKWTWRKACLEVCAWIYKEFDTMNDPVRKEVVNTFTVYLVNRFTKNFKVCVEAMHRDSFGRDI